jgi:hypothetical protein
MKMIKFIILFFFTSYNLVLADTKSTTPSLWNVEFFLGNAHSLPSRVTVRQKGYPEESKIAHWSTRPTEPAPYYSARVGLWKDNQGWDVEMLHHKLYMNNTDAVFNNYRSTFGFNFFFLNRGWRVHPNIILRFGLGPVISHPVNTIRGQQYTDNVTYKLVGAGTQVAAQFRQTIYKGLYLTQEIKTTYAMARLPIANGRSYLTNLAFHGLVGLGVEF